MNFLKNLGIVSNGLGNLPYSIDSDASAVPSGSSLDGNVATSRALSHRTPDFEILPGKAKADKSRVSIFRSVAPASARTQNALRRMRTIRHPNVLSCLDGVETPKGQVIIVTEEVIPLTQWMEDLRLQSGKQSEEETKGILWGTYSILSALSFIHNDCKMVHGNLTPSSIFVTKGGDWKLGSFGILSEWTSDGPSTHFTSQEGDAFVDSSYKSPERLRREWRTVGSAHPSAMDMWSLGCLLYAIGTGSTATGTQIALKIGSGSTSAALIGSLPADLVPIMGRMLKELPNHRITSNQALESPCFKNSEFIRTMLFVECIAAKAPDEKTAFYRTLPNQLSAFSKSCARFKILPALRSVVEIAGGDKAAGVKLDPSASYMLPIMIQIGNDLMEEEFKEEILPTVVKLFSCNDRAVRVQLLQTMDSFTKYLDGKIVNSTIFEHISTGFSDTTPILRELTVKCMLHLADKLSDTNLNTRLVKYFNKLQGDSEPAIRTNTTICFGKIAVYLPQKTRNQVLLPAFSRALKDPFPHARLAGLKAMYACEEYFEPDVISRNILPCICPLLMDRSSMVRDEAFPVVNGFIRKLEPVSAQMKDDEEKAAAEAKRKQLLEKSAPTSARASSHPDGSQSESKSYASSFAGWAASSVVSGMGKLVVGDERLDAKPTPCSSPPASSASVPLSKNLPSTRSKFSKHDPSMSSHSRSSTVSSSNANPAPLSPGWDDFDSGNGWGEDLDLDLDSPKTASSTPSGGISTNTLGHSNVPGVKFATSSKNNNLSGGDFEDEFEDSGRAWGSRTKSMPPSSGLKLSSKTVAGLSASTGTRKSMEQRKLEMKQKREERKREAEKKATAALDLKNVKIDSGGDDWDW